MALAHDDTSLANQSQDRTLVPVHPESVAGDARALRWICPAGTLDFVGAPAELPAILQRLLDDATLESVSAEPAAVQTRLATGRTWQDHGAQVRDALQAALGAPGQWRAAAGTAPGDDVLRQAVLQVINGQVGDYIRSHGGQVELLTAHDDEVEVRLSGACGHCPASDVTLTDRLEVGIRALYPGLRTLTARNDPGTSMGRRMLRLLPTRLR